MGSGSYSHRSAKTVRDEQRRKKTATKTSGNPETKHSLSGYEDPVVKAKREKEAARQKLIREGVYKMANKKAKKYTKGTKYAGADSVKRKK